MIVMIFGYMSSLLIGQVSARTTMAAGCSQRKLSPAQSAIGPADLFSSADRWSASMMAMP